MPENETFGQRIRRLRKSKGLTQEQVASVCLVSGVTVNRWEKDTRQPRAEELKRLAAALNVSEEELLNGAPEQGGWVLQIKIATEIKEEIIDMRAKNVPIISNLTCTPQGGGFSLYGSYEIWADKKKFKALLKQLEQARNLVLQNGIALGGIKEEEK